MLGQGKSVSLISRSISEVEELSDEELIKKVNELRRHVKLLQLENQILERTLIRYDPALMTGVQQALEYANRAPFMTQSTISSIGRFSTASRYMLHGDSFISPKLTSPSRMLHSPSRMLTSPSKTSTSKFPERLGGTIICLSGPKINIQEKHELASIEIEIIVKHLEKIRAEAAKQHAFLKAQIEEIEVRVGRIEKAMEEFNQEVIIDGLDKIAQRIPAEIWIRFMNDWVKVCDTQIGKLRLRTSTLNTQYSKYKGLIKVREELNENLRPVDFDKIAIENQECMRLIGYKRAQVEELKKMTGDANLTLTVHKNLLMEQENNLKSILESIQNKKKLTKELDIEKEAIRSELEKVTLEYEDIKKVRQAYEVPDIMDYVQTKNEMTDLQQCIKRLMNRLHVYQIALKSLNMKLRQNSSERPCRLNADV